MSLVAVTAAAGSSGVTTTSLVLASMVPTGQPVVFAECDRSGGDVAAWAGTSETPGWSTAVAAGDRSWRGLERHLQQLPSGLAVMCAPTLSRQAKVVVPAAAEQAAVLLAAMSDVVTIADCGRMDDGVPVWANSAQLVLLLVRQLPVSPGATVARIERAGEVLAMLQQARCRVGVVLIGARPYGADEIADRLGVGLYGALPEDPNGAGIAAGGWTVGRGASRTPLARAVKVLSARVIETLDVWSESSASTEMETSA